MTENSLAILIIIFSVQLQQTEISERKLSIFHLGSCLVHRTAATPQSCPQSLSDDDESFARGLEKVPVSP